MSREETKEILKAIQGYYQNFNPTDMAATLELWNMTLEEYTYRDVSMALLSFFKTDDKGFAPVPGQLISIIHEMNEPHYKPEAEAYNDVLKAIERSGWYAKEEFDKLDPISQKVVGSPDRLHGLGQLTPSQVEHDYQPNFIRAYRTEVDRAKEYAKLPEEVRLRIDAVNKVNNRPHIYEGRMIGDKAANE